jgi:hypothetical protein
MFSPVTCARPSHSFPSMVLAGNIHPRHALNNRRESHTRRHMDLKPDLQAVSAQEVCALTHVRIHVPPKYVSWDMAY